MAKNVFLFNWLSAWYNKNAVKIKKSAQGVLHVMEKFYFCNPKRQRHGTTWGAGLSTGGCSLKEWKNVANTQEIGIWDSQAMRPGQTTKDKRN